MSVRRTAAGTPFFSGPSARRGRHGPADTDLEIPVNKILRKVKRAWQIMGQVNRERAVGMLEFELKELENIFTLLILGGFVGMPSPPAPIAIELLPLLEREMAVMLNRSDFAQDPVGALMGILEVD